MRIHNDTRTLILPCGLPRSGKDTWIWDTYLGMVPVVEPDAIRMVMHGTAHKPNMEPMVWATAHMMVESLFMAGHPMVILNAQNLRAHTRREWETGTWKTLYKIIDTPVEVCKQRAILTNQEYLLPVIERNAKNIEWPTVNLI